MACWWPGSEQHHQEPYQSSGMRQAYSFFTPGGRFTILGPDKMNHAETDVANRNSHRNITFICLGRNLGNNHNLFSANLSTATVVIITPTASPVLVVPSITAVIRSRIVWTFIYNIRVIANYESGNGLEFISLGRSAVITWSECSCPSTPSFSLQTHNVRHVTNSPHCSRSLFPL